MSALQDLSRSVDEFASIVVNLPDANLDRPWKWGDYDEGVRFIFFRVYETLRSLEAAAVGQRATAARPQTRAQAILGMYQLAFRRLHTVMLAVDDELGSRPPSEGEWPLRRIMAHMVGGELSFWKINAEALLAVRRGVTMPPPVEEEEWVKFESEEPVFKDLESGPLSVLLKHHVALNQRTLQTFSDVSDRELDTPVWFWEEKPMPMHFRLHRFDSHISQHTIQAKKTLAALGHPPTESRRLLLNIYQALAGCEGVLLGAAMDDAPLTTQAAHDVEEYVRQITQEL